MIGENVNIVNRSRSSACEMYWKPLVDLADDVLVGHEHVVEEDVVGALVAHRPDAVDGDAGVVERHEEQRDAVVLGASGSVRAPTQYHSAKCAEVVHVFCPLRIQPTCRRARRASALSFIDAASEPALGSL